MESTLMKRLWFIAILAAGVTACVEGNNPVQLVNAFPLTDSCDLADKARLRGMLNFNAGTSYNIAFTLYSPLEVAPGDNASPAGFTAQEIILSYEARNPKVTLNEESEPIYFVVPPGADTESYIALNLIGTEARLHDVAGHREAQGQAGFGQGSRDERGDLSHRHHPGELVRAWDGARDDLRCAVCLPGPGCQLQRFHLRAGNGWLTCPSSLLKRTPPCPSAHTWSRWSIRSTEPSPAA
jgi:hypothetical protein